VSGRDSPTELGRRLDQALALADEGLEIMGQNLRRRHPDASDEEIQERLSAWVNDRPPDCPGPSRTIPGL
jgi:hypothetical protein